LGARFLALGQGLSLGCVLLLLPGIYLAARWMIAAPAIIGEDLSARAGMRESWERTRDSVWPIAGALVIVVGRGFVAAMIPVMVYG
jgi:membrane-anchored glycerophosphoryl diester phosphodiesterase (GDPDase)